MGRRKARPRWHEAGTTVPFKFHASRRRGENVLGELELIEGEGNRSCDRIRLIGLRRRRMRQEVERPGFPDGHSVRSAAIGSMHAARQAGIMDATRDTRPSRNAELVNMTGSHGC